LTLFLQIFFGNILLLFVLITVHECGHWVMGRLAGMPGRLMRIRLFTFPQQVVVRDDASDAAGGGWVSVSNYDRYWEVFRRHVPSRGGQFLYVVGGFIFETLFLVALVLWLALEGYLMFAAVAAGVSLTMYVIYLFAMDLPEARAKGKPWGDTSILISLARGGGIAVAVAMVAVRLILLGGVGLAALVR
jgi:hypothetical protein